MQKAGLHVLAVGVMLTISAVATAQTCISDSIRSTTPTDRFIVRDQGVIVDAKTGLTWTRCAIGQEFNDLTRECQGEAEAFTQWTDAMARVATANNRKLGGKTRWRAPSIKELGSIIERECYEPSINLELFPGTENVVFWSSTPRNPAIHGETARYIDFTMGEEFTDALTVSGQLRLVHD